MSTRCLVTYELRCEQQLLDDQQLAMPTLLLRHEQQLLDDQQLLNCQELLMAQDWPFLTLLMGCPGLVWP